MTWLCRKRRVRLHFLEKDAPSVEGILCGTVAGHYRLRLPSILQSVGQTMSVEGELWVPKARVFLIETLRAAA